MTERFTAVPANLFKIAAAGKAADPYCRPAEVRHHLCQTSKRAGGPIALWHFKQVQQRLTANALQPVKEVDVASDGFA
jgi:hypothetical protein